MLLLAIAVAGVLIWRNSKGTGEKATDDAVVAAEQGRFAEVEPALRAAHERTPDDARVVEALARGYMQTGDRASAERFMTKWIELRPNDANPLRMRYEFYREQKNREAAYADAKKLLEIEHPNSPTRRQAYAQFRRSVAGQAFSLARFEEAEQFCKDGLKDDPGDLALKSLYAEVRRARGDIAGAGEVLDQILKDHPKHTPALLARGINYLEAGAPEKAVPLLREVLKTDRTRQRTAGHQLVIALERTGQAEEAKRVAAEVRRLQDVDVYGEAIKSQPDNLEIRVRLAERLLADGHTDDGVAQLRAVLSVDPRNRAAHLALADHYDRVGQQAEAARHRKLADTP